MAQKLRSTGATLSMRDLKEKAGKQATIDREKLLHARNKTRAAQAERKAKRMMAVATKELEELIAPGKAPGDAQQPSSGKAKKK